LAVELGMSSSTINVRENPAEIKQEADGNNQANN
jgi:hypothetical protein